jgi:hypothetical protein
MKFSYFDVAVHAIMVESEGSPKYKRILIIFPDFSSTRQDCHTEQGFRTGFIPLRLISVLLQASLAQGVDPTFQVGRVFISISGHFADPI